MKHEILQGDVNEVTEALRVLEDTWDVEIVSTTMGGYTGSWYIMVVKILRPKY
jgi:putative N-acetylmannosamine-6-phosphate epimerase